MLEQFRKDSTKIPRAEQDNTIQFLTGTMEFNDIKFNKLMKSLQVTNKLDGLKTTLRQKRYSHLYEEMQIVSLCHCEGDLLDL